MNRSFEKFKLIYCNKLKLYNKSLKKILKNYLILNYK